MAAARIERKSRVYYLLSAEGLTGTAGPARHAGPLTGPGLLPRELPEPDLGPAPIYYAPGRTAKARQTGYFLDRYLY